MKTLPPWETRDLPEAPPFTLRNLFRVIGPGAILLASSIGGGEWLVGPAIGVQFGRSLLWIATLAIVLQLLFNLEAVRYTMYTGEPVITGFMRLRPGPRLWAPVYAVLCVAQVGMPALAAGTAATVFATFAGRMPGAQDSGALLVATYGVLALALVILLFGETIERTLERVSWVMVVFIFGFLAFVNVCFVPARDWVSTIVGFFSVGGLPEGIDLALLGALAASSGSGGFGNLAISNWYRDKGFGMAAHSGAIASATSSLAVHVAPTGSVFRPSAANLARWKRWWQYARADQVWLWAAGCFVGMFLNVNLAASVVPPGTDLSQIGAGAYQAEYLALNVWQGFWFLALLNGFWVLFSTHLGNTEVLVRMLTDIAWAGSPAIRGLVRNHARTLYYALFLGFTAWYGLAVRWGTAMEMMKWLGNVGGLVLAFSSVQILLVNTRLLPPEVRPPLWRRIALGITTIAYGTVFIAVVRSVVT